MLPWLSVVVIKFNLLSYSLKRLKKTLRGTKVKHSTVIYLINKRSKSYKKREVVPECGKWEIYKYTQHIAVKS